MKKKWNVLPLISKILQTKKLEPGFLNGTKTRADVPVEIQNVEETLQIIEQLKISKNRRRYQKKRVGVVLVFFLCQVL